VVTSYLQKLGVRQGNFRKLLPLFPRAFSKLELGDARVVVTSSSAFAHGIQLPDDAMQVCYCHSPFRYVWHERVRALAEVPAPIRFALAFELERIRKWDLAASRSVDVYVANSQITRERIKEYYGRDSVVVHPPVDVDRFDELADPEDFYLFVGEVVAHKRVETAINACKMAGRKLVVVGSGPDQERLQRLYGSTVTFAGRVSDSELNELLATCRALIAPNVEEFGIAAVEAQAAGRPVIGRAMGGTAETVIHGQTGVLVRGQRRDDFADGIRLLESLELDPAAIAQHAQQFSVAEFQRRMTDVVLQSA
jgi:glycosyltransferase involved in cell wall biosynthesis